MPLKLINSSLVVAQINKYLNLGYVFFSDNKYLTLEIASVIPALNGNYYLLDRVIVTTDGLVTTVITP